MPGMTERRSPALLLAGIAVIGLPACATTFETGQGPATISIGKPDWNKLKVPEAAASSGPTVDRTLDCTTAREGFTTFTFQGKTGETFRVGIKASAQRPAAVLPHPATPNARIEVRDGDNKIIVPEQVAPVIATQRPITVYERLLENRPPQLYAACLPNIAEIDTNKITEAFRTLRIEAKGPYVLLKDK